MSTSLTSIVGVKAINPIIPTREVISAIFNSLSSVISIMLLLIFEIKIGVRISISKIDLSWEI
jgi:hypothetical protein